MPTYEFRCPTHGPFEALLPIARSRGPAPCVECGAEGVRLLSAPRLNLGDSTARRLLDATARSASDPAVVSAPPGRPAARPRTAPDPRTARLPRP
ncbi:zinc ribbon domain-containing protein [Enemella evansiae]|uniref:FmdB family transcriptional regulator n=1 Tax=Enemella evansiae TaxID=2016499 RepID=A0A255GPX5_9ACTN|nr:zinc ribbon domain-containing protein [Enemella evansiae]OYN95629.1 FmdB family transcriptional regulator [Enemella evansiae]OYO17877.1 FmdB family transcriptional regulator [Enemella evansiae]TDO89947.1 putative FmdB family regulatory protein [Enemella evansiae]